LYTNPAMTRRITADSRVQSTMIVTEGNEPILLNSASDTLKEENDILVHLSAFANCGNKFLSSN